MQTCILVCKLKKIAYALPFVHSVEMERAVLVGNLQSALPHLLVVLAYAITILVGAILLFLGQTKKQ